MIVVVDVETTGLPKKRLPDLDWRQPHIVELAASLVTVDNEMIAEMSRIVRPDGWVSEPDALAVHGITHEEALAKGRPEAEVVREFVQLALRASLLVAHNAAFEQHIVRIALSRFWPQDLTWWWDLPRFCTMEGARRACGIGKLAPAYEHLCGQPHATTHEAIGDVDAARGIYFALGAPANPPMTGDPR